MKIDILSKTTLKLTLTPEDMSENRICYESFAEQGSRCRQTLGKLLKSSDKPEGAAMAARLLNSERRLFVGSFSLALRRLKEAEKQGAGFHSRLFSNGTDYRLALIPTNVCMSKLNRLLKEYGQVCRDELTAAFTEEHYRVLAEEKGAEKGARIF